MKRLTKALHFLGIHMIKGNAPFLSTRGNSQPPAKNEKAATPRHIGDILWKGTDEELREALRKLPDGHCDLKDYMLRTEQVNKLVAAIKHVPVQRISFGITSDTEKLLEAIPHSLVSEWDFVGTLRLGSDHVSLPFPNAGEVARLATAISQLDHHSSTKRVFINPSALDDEAKEKLPTCFEGSVRPVKLCITHPALTSPSPQHDSTVSSSVASTPVLVDANMTSLSKDKYATALLLLLTAVGAGDVTSTQAVINTQLPGCSLEQFELCKTTAAALAALNDRAAAAAEEVSKLTFPIATQPRKPPISLGPLQFGHPEHVGTPTPTQGKTVNFSDLVGQLRRYITSGNSQAPHPLSSENGQLLPLSDSQKDVLRNIAKNYQFDANESVKAVALATLDLLRE